MKLKLLVIIIMIISHKYKFIFIKNRKTAGTAIELFLSNFLGINDIQRPHPTYDNLSRNLDKFFIDYKTDKNCINCKLLNLIKNKKISDHIPLTNLYKYINDINITSYYKFCVERHPYEKTISQFLYNKDRMYKNVSFDDYIFSHKLPTDQSKYTINNNIAVDYIIQYDKLVYEISHVLKRINIPYIGILGKFINKRKYTYEINLTNIHKTIIQDVFKNEINYFKYKL